MRKAMAFPPSVNDSDHRRTHPDDHQRGRREGQRARKVVQTILDHLAKAGTSCSRRPRPQLLDEDKPGELVKKAPKGSLQ